MLVCRDEVEQRMGNVPEVLGECPSFFNRPERIWAFQQSFLLADQPLSGELLPHSLLLARTSAAASAMPCFATKARFEKPMVPIFEVAEGRSFPLLPNSILRRAVKDSPLAAGPILVSELQTTVVIQGRPGGVFLDSLPTNSSRSEGGSANTSLSRFFATMCEF